MEIAERQQSTAANDLELLERLNREYIRAVENKDPRWFDEHLTPDFLNSNPDGSLVDRQAFLAQIAQGTGSSDIQAHDIRIRIMGDLAIVHARTTSTKRDGTTGAGRYTDVWFRRDGQWMCVAAQVTRC